jgi:hypothetical protein
MRERHICHQQLFSTIGEHQFIYEEKTLCAALQDAGFTTLVKCDLQTSASEAFCSLEHERRMPENFLKLETLTIEGMKP